MKSNRRARREPLRREYANAVDHAAAEKSRADADTLRSARGALQFMERLAPFVEMLAKLDPYGHLSRYECQPPDLALRYWDETVSLLATFCGLVQTRYTTIDRDNRPVEQVTDARRP